MHYFAIIAGLCWAVFILVWFVSALGAKRNLHTYRWQNPWLRIIVILGICFVIRERIYIAFNGSLALPMVDPTIGGIGALLAVVGIAIAIWARLYIGTNWGMPMTLKENRQLVTGGPYHYIRHPIYAGMMLNMIGSVLAIGLWWIFIVFAMYSLYFIYSALSEEKTLAREFPGEYPLYKKRTKMFIPFIV